MISGSILTGDKLCCSNCKTEIKKEFNFCPNCCNSLNEIANNYQQEVQKNIKLNVANQILSLTDDKKLALEINELIKRF